MESNKSKKSLRERFFKIILKIKKKLYKRRNYLIRHHGILVILAIMGVLLFSYHCLENISKIEQNLWQFIIILLAKFGLDLSFVLIPVALYLINIRKKFQKEFEALFSLKERILHIRKEVANAITEGQDIYEREAIVLSPIILNDIKKELRRFKFTNEADLLDEFLNMKLLYQIDILLIKIIELTKDYDKGFFYESLEINEQTKFIIGKLESIKPKPPLSIEIKNFLIEKFLNEVLWIITYKLFFNLESKCPATIIYYDLSEIPKRPFQTIFDAITDICEIYIRNRNNKFVVGNIPINLKKLETNKDKLIELNIIFEKIYDESDNVFIYWIYILDEPMNILRIKIALSEGYEISIPWKREGDREKSEIYAYLSSFSEKYNLEIKNKKFWES